MNWFDILRRMPLRIMKIADNFCHISAPDFNNRHNPAPLPSIPTASNTASPQTRSAKVILSLEERMVTPLPAIGQPTDAEKRIHLPKCPIVLLFGECSHL